MRKTSSCLSFIFFLRPDLQCTMYCTLSTGRVSATGKKISSQSFIKITTEFHSTSRSTQSGKHHPQNQKKILWTITSKSVSNRKGPRWNTHYWRSFLVDFRGTFWKLLHFFPCLPPQVFLRIMNQYVFSVRWMPGHSKFEENFSVKVNRDRILASMVSWLYDTM